MKEATLDDVAHRVGVSARTVSRVVNGQGGCAPDTKARILAAIDELRYRPNMLARGLITRRSDTVGLVVAEMTDPYFVELADSIQRAARATGRTMFLASTLNDAAQQRDVLRTLLGHGVDGVILFPAASTDNEVIAIGEGGLPIVLMDVAMTGRNLGVVMSDIADGARQATHHLIDGGRRRLGMVTDSRSAMLDRAPRREGTFRQVLADAGLAHDDSLVVRSANTIAGGAQAAIQLIEQHPEIDAIFAYNDLMAIGALNALQRAGRRVPDDVAVVGFDDIALCQALTPTLSTVRLDRDKVGQRAVAMLHAMIEDRGDSGDTAVVDVTLIPRESSAAPAVSSPPIPLTPQPH